MSWDDMLAADAESFLDALGGEDITYTPRGGVARTISAIVERATPGALGAAAPVSGSSFTVTVRNDSTYGIAEASMNVGGDTIALAPRRGGTAQTFRLVQPESQDAGMLTFRFNQ